MSLLRSIIDASSPCISIASSLPLYGARASWRATAHGVSPSVFRGDAHIGSFREFFLELCGDGGARGYPTPAGSSDFDALPASTYLTRWIQPVAEAREVPRLRQALEDRDRLLDPALRAQGSGSGSGSGGAPSHIYIEAEISEIYMRPAVRKSGSPARPQPSASFCCNGVR